MKYLILIIFIVLLTSCSPTKIVNDNDLIVETYKYKTPKDMSDGWVAGSLKDARVNKEKLEELVEVLKKGHKFHSISVARYGKLILDEYFQGSDKYNIHPTQEKNEEYLHIIQSSTKSINSMALGAAKFNGFDIDLDETLADIFSQEYKVDWTGNKKKIKLIHALTFTTGLDWNEWEGGTSLREMDDFAYSDPSGNPLNFVLGLKSIHEPGSVFAYCSGISILLGEVIRYKTGLYVDKFCEKYFFEPMQIEDYYWIKYPNGICHTGAGLYLRSRDFLKFGQLYLNKGIWKGERIIGEKWLEESTEEYNAKLQSYGYQWWIEYFSFNNETYKVSAMYGDGGEQILIFKDLDLVIALTGGYYGQDFFAPTKLIIENFLLPSINK